MRALIDSELSRRVTPHFTRLPWAQHGLLGQLEAALDPSDPVKFDDVPRALQDAQGYMERGLEEAPSAGKGLNGALQLFENEFVKLMGTPDTSLSSGASDYFF
jgi:hypothetical protein